MRRFGVLAAALLAAALPTSVESGKKEEKAKLEELTAEHPHPSGVFTFKTPADWTVGPVPDRTDLYQASSGELLVRFLYRSGEAGYDSLHADCMLERLAGAMDTSPQVRYEYDFLGGVFGNRRVLDSAFEIRYDAAVAGHRDWRQRNFTVVGEGHSLCVISHAPAAVFKRASAVRRVLDAIVKSVTFR